MTTIRLKRGLAATWASVNPVLADGEPGVEHDTKRMKLGDGLTAWNELSYLSEDLLLADLDGRYASQLAVGAYVGLPSGGDDTAAVLAAVNSISGLGTLVFGPGQYKFANITVSGAATGLTVVGAGPSATTLTPNGTGRLFTFSGLPDGFSMSKLTIGFRSGASETDFPYTNPFIELVSMTGWQFSNVTFRTQGMGTGLKLTSAFNGHLQNVTFRMGRWGVPLESSGTVQSDTITFTNVISASSCPVIFRGSTGGLDSLRLAPYKCVAQSPDGSVWYESVLAVTANAGDTTVTLNTGDGAQFTAGMPIFFGKGTTFECNKVLSVAGDVVTLTQALLYAHNPATAGDAQVIKGAIGLSISSNSQNVSMPGSHFEGYGIGAMIDGTVQNLDVGEGVYSSCGRLLRLCGATQDAHIGAVFMNGNAGIGANILIDIPSYNVASITRLYLDGPFPKLSGGVAITLVNDPGSNTTNMIYRSIETPNSVPMAKWSTNSVGTNLVEETLVSSVVKWSRDYNGKQTWSGDTNLYRSAAGLLRTDTDFEARALKLDGLTGATAAGRLGGATAGGAPVSGTWAVGDAVTDQTGMQWVCIAAGTPGTWAPVGLNRENIVTGLGYYHYLGASAVLTTGGTNSPATTATFRASPFVVGRPITILRLGAEVTVIGDAGRSVADAVTNGTTTVTSATAAFVAGDVGRSVTGTNIPAGTYIASRTDASTIVLTQAATGSGSGGTLAISGPVVRIGIYADAGVVGGASPASAALVLDAGTIDGASVAVQEIVLGSPLVLNRGIYWVGAANIGVTSVQPTLRAIIPNSMSTFCSYSASMPSANSAPASIAQAVPGAGLPLNFSGTPSAQGNGPRIFAKVQ